MKAFVFCLAFCTALILSIPAHASGPKVSLSTETWDFGTIYQWDSPSISITIKNLGDEELKILDVKASCGCTVAVLSDKVVKPGGAASMKVDFSAYNSTGRVRKIVKLTTNDPAAPEKVLTINGVVRADKGAVGFLDQTYLDMGVIAPYETRYFDLKLSNKGNVEMRFKGLDLPAGYFVDSSLPDRIPERTDTYIKVGYRPTKPKGPINDEIKVLLINPRPGQEELKLRLAGYVAERVRVGDSIIVTPTEFRVAPGTKDPSIEVAVKNDGNGTVVIEGVESSLDAALQDTQRVEIAPGESGKARLSLKPEGLKPDSRGFLYLRLAVPVIVEGAGNK
jgi:hypothetical protein